MEIETRCYKHYKVNYKGDKNKSNVIYLIIDNNKYYIGKTSRSVKERLKEHIGTLLPYNGIKNVIILDSYSNKKEGCNKENEWIRRIGEKIIQRKLKTKQKYDNPLIFDEVKNLLNKIY